jgi:hypothetical protein
VEIERWEKSKEDLAGVLRCESLVLVAEEPPTPTRAGRMVEFGVAIGTRKKLICIGALQDDAAGRAIYRPGASRAQIQVIIPRGEVGSGAASHHLPELLVLGSL